MKQITPKDKKALAICGLFITCYVMFIYIGTPIYNKHKSVEKQIQEKILFIEKYQKIINQKSYYKQKKNQIESSSATLSQRFLNETKPALAAASQQRLLEDIARKTGVNIVRVKIHKPKYIENLLSISTKITTRSSLRNLALFIQMIESNKKFLVIEDILTQRTNRTGLEELQSQLTISGFIKKIKEEKVNNI